jgi:pimeloyl-ACP methyl ester carboxylesterase
MTTHEITIADHSGPAGNAAPTLAGSLVVPDGTGPYPAILFVHGSGPVDRNENTSGPLKLNVFNKLADFFALAGWASLRYDKRGTGQSSGVFEGAGRTDLLSDAQRALAFLKGRPEIDPRRIVVAGHSEGALLAPALYRLEPFAGMILLAGAAGSLKDTLLWQMDQIARDLAAAKGFKGTIIRLFRLDQRLRKDQSRLLARIESSTGETIKHQGRTIRVKWFREHFAHSCSEDLPYVDCPVFVATGSKDVQVPPEDAGKIAFLCGSHKDGKTESYIIPDMTHVLRKDEAAEGAVAILKGYKHAGTTEIHPRLLSLLGGWLEKLALMFKAG